MDILQALEGLVNTMVIITVHTCTVVSHTVYLDKGKQTVPNTF